ncbi:MAG: HAD hydrolase-like protein [Candidatus Obscuribacterales bacterium]|nr:HAD hydrolase-like protein [Candidatus Obscuribacterales bacterium]
MVRLVLFDIDETMISSNGAGRRAIGRMLSKTFGIDPREIKVSMSGKTDPQILAEIFKAADLDESQMTGKQEEMFEFYLSVLQEEVNKANRYIMHDGVVALLECLLTKEKCYLGLLTGNIERGARIKLERFGLNKYFPLGAYGSDSHDRMHLPAIATDRATEHYQVNFAPSQVVIIGDSIYDVMCAKGYGAKSIAVNTGSTSLSDLEEQKPDFLFTSLANTDEVVEAIFS